MITGNGTTKMNREYMLKKIDERLYELQKRYEELCQEDNGHSLSGGACVRSRTKRDICILTLLYEVVYQCRECTINNEDALLGFEKLVRS